jgi:hypothetical protein
MRIPKQRLALAWLSVCLLLASAFGASRAAAADTNNDRRIAQARCSPCHIVVPFQLRLRDARQGRNPRTGAAVLVSLTSHDQTNTTRVQRRLAEWLRWIDSRPATPSSTQHMLRPANAALANNCHTRPV